MHTRATHALCCPESASEGGGYASLFFATIAALEKEKVLRYSEQGPFVVQILQLLKEEQQKPSVVGMVMKLITRLESCLNAGAKYRLPSASQKKIWSARFDQAVIKVWDDYMLAMKLPEVLHGYTSLAFQLIFDRLMKALISSQKNDLVTPTQARPMPVLSLREKNVVQYMGGFVALKLHKRYSKNASNSQLQRKRRLFTSVLKNMRAENQPHCLDTYDDYTRVWAEQIDRGGLYHINPQVRWLKNTVKVVLVLRGV